MISQPLELRWLPLDQLTPAPYNPRRELRPDSPAYRKLAASLREFGLVEPLVWNEQSGHVVGGHARLRILRDLGVAEVPVSVVRLGPQREKALNIVLNNREAQGRFDPDRLHSVLAEFESLPELALTGFDEADLAAFKWQPLPNWTPPAPPDRVEVTLVTTRAGYDRLASRLDELVRDLDLVCHVRGL